jgi:hypothetical protein
LKSERRKSGAHEYPVSNHNSIPAWSRAQTEIFQLLFNTCWAESAALLLISVKTAPVTIEFSLHPASYDFRVTVAEVQFFQSISGKASEPLSSGSMLFDGRDYHL